jgi:hypothetical protein
MKSRRYKKNKNKSTKKGGSFFSMIPGEGSNINNKLGLNNSSDYKSDNNSFYGKGLLGAALIAGVAIIIVKFK